MKVESVKLDSLTLDPDACTCNGKKNAYDLVETQKAYGQSPG